MAFEVFDRKGTPTTSKPWVTIQSRGNFGMNRAAFEALGEPIAVELLFDAEARRVGFRPADPEALNAYPVRKQANSDSYVLAGRAFTNYYKIDTSEARRYDVEMVGDILAIDLNDVGATVSRG